MGQLNEMWYDSLNSKQKEENLVKSRVNKLWNFVFRREPTSVCQF